MSEIIKLIELSYKYDYETALKEKNIILDKLDYPFLKYFVSEDKIKENFIRLINTKPRIVFEKFHIDSVRLSEQDLQFEGTPLLLISTVEDYENLDMLSDYFNEHCRVHCRFFNSVGSIHDYYRNHLDKLIMHLKENNLKINIQNLREMIWKYGKKDRFGECSTFKPKFIKFFIEHYSAKRILDISSGWGDRLIGAMASDIECYHGFDPNSCLHDGYNKIIKFFSDLAVNPKVECLIKELPFEQSELQESYYDLVMTSPPYFDIEIYDNDNPKQSTHKRSEREWYNNYLLKWINICSKALKKNAILALNINQFRHHHYVQWLISDMKKNPNWNFLGTIGYTNENKKNVQPIFVFRNFKK
jgi:hypothetical protein